MTQADQVGFIRLSPRQMQHPQLLAGFDQWIQLGLLSPAEVMEFCRLYLVCPLPPLPASALPQPEVSQPELQPESLPEPASTPGLAAANRFADDFADAAPAAAAPAALAAPEVTALAPRSWLSRSLQAFRAEIGVIWLLGLGVFLVVVSSGVLAASQWQMVSPLGQYGILLTYTLAFWGASRWTGRRATLRLTAQMLQLATLLLVPLNFWMMDGLNLWRQPLGLGLNLLAAGILALISRSLVNGLANGLANGLVPQHRLAWINLLGLSGLHWGWSWNWGWAGIPLLASYVGTIGTAVLTVRALRQRHRDSAEIPEAQPAIAVTTGVTTLALLLLLGRAVLAAQVPLNQLGLAIGICGWLFGWLNRSRPINFWTQLGWAGLLLGWAVTVAENPAQALAVSGLGLWLLGDRILNNRILNNRILNNRVLDNRVLDDRVLDDRVLDDRVLDDRVLNNQVDSRAAQEPQSGAAAWLALLLLGLQTYALFWRLWPLDLRQSLVAGLTAAWGGTGMPLALVALAGFPYLWLLLGLARWRRRDPDLVRLTKGAALGLGGLLLLLGWFNPVVRAIGLTLAALTLTASLSRRRQTLWLYLSQLLILAALFAWVAARFPGLDHLAWAKLALVAMAVEWGLSLGERRPWRQTCWHFGLGLAALSYGLLWQERLVTVSAAPGSWLTNPGLWLLTPLALTGLAWWAGSARLPGVRPTTAAGLSAASLVAQLLLLSSSRDALVVCAVAAGLMLLNLVPLQTAPAAAELAAGLTVGFGLAAELAAIVTFTQLTFSTALLWLAATLWLLWLLQLGLMQRSGSLGQLCGRAARRWFLGLALLGLLVLTGHLGLAASLNQPIAGQTALGSLLIGLVLAAQLLHSVRQTSARQTSTRQQGELLVYQLAWAVELVIVALVSWRVGWQSGTDLLAILTLALGLATQLGGDLAMAKSGGRSASQPPALQNWPASWQIIPLAYGALGLFYAHVNLLGLGLANLTPTTGLYTLAAAAIGLGVGRRLPQLKPVALGGLLLASGAAYELLLYRLLQASGGSWGDGVALLAGLAALIAWLLRLGRPWLLPYLRLSPAELGGVAHLHWGLGSSLALLATSGLSHRGFWVWLVVAIGLSGYALINGRLVQPPPEQSALEQSENSAAQRLPQLVNRSTNNRTSNRASNRTANNGTTDPWTYAGIAQLLGLASYSLIYWLPDSTWLGGWAAMLAALAALVLYFSPWPSWGWSARPWQTMALLWPGTVLLLTAPTVTLQSLLLVAAFYAWIAKAAARPRFSYVGLLLLDWAVLRYLTSQGWLNLTWLSAVLAASLLYLAQVDPALQTGAAKQQRHALRSFAVGLLSLTLLYQAEVESGQAALLISGFTLLGSLGLVLLGLALRTRAFLYVGTLTFVLKVLRLFWLLINTDSLLLWASGILVGLSFIWVAATFEARRSQVGTLMQYWLGEFERWE